MIALFITVLHLNCSTKEPLGGVPASLFAFHPLRQSPFTPQAIHWDLLWKILGIRGVRSSNLSINTATQAGRRVKVVCRMLVISQLFDQCSDCGCTLLNVNFFFLGSLIFKVKYQSDCSSGTGKIFFFFLSGVFLSSSAVIYPSV